VNGHIELVTYRGVRAVKLVPAVETAGKGQDMLALGEHGAWSEVFYLRPTNGRADDQLRRNHAVQYVSHLEFPGHRLRQESPGVYESYADRPLGLGNQQDRSQNASPMLRLTRSRLGTRRRTALFVPIGRHRSERMSRPTTAPSAAPAGIAIP